MKLAEALIERADVQRHLAQLQARLLQNAQYQEGESPAEDPAALLDEYRRANEALHRLIVQINLANQRAVVADGTGMVAALAERADAATPEQSRYSRSEIKMLAAVDSKELRRCADDTAKACRLLDIQIQQANWAEDL